MSETDIIGQENKGSLAVVIIPTFNERENIERLAREINELPISKEIIVVDDNSPDGTGKIVDELCHELTTLHVIHREKKLGLGTAYTSGFKMGLSLQADFLITMDADFSHHPKYIPDLIKKAQETDVSIGSRYINHGGTKNFGLHRQILSRTANLIARSILRMSPHDCTSGFRCYNRIVFEKIDPTSIVSDGYSFLVEMLFRCLQHRFTVGEVPILFVNRAEGISKVSKKEIFKAIKTIAMLRRERIRL